MTAYLYAILYHNYYSPEGIDAVRQKIGALSLPISDGTCAVAAPLSPAILLLCSLPDKFADLYPLQREHEKFIVAANVGKDIGGKLILLELLLTLYPEIPYAILLHDKRSYQKHSGRWERDGLFSIIDPDKFPVISAAFEHDDRLGIACARGYIRNEYLGDGRFDTSNSDMLREQMNKFAIPDGDLRFVAGTMFWIRTSLLRDFFSAAGPLAVRGSLESGNVLDHEHGTMTHCWERILSWIALSANYKMREF